MITAPTKNNMMITRRNIRSCRKISGTDCAGYFFGCAGQKTQGYVGLALRGTMRSMVDSLRLRRGFLTCAAGEIDKSRYVSYFSTAPKPYIPAHHF